MTRTISADTDILPDFAAAEGLEAVRQRVHQRLRFPQGEWFLDGSEGVPYHQVVFANPRLVGLAAQVIATEIGEVEGVTAIEITEASVDSRRRRMRFGANVETIHGRFSVDQET